MSAENVFEIEELDDWGIEKIEVYRSNGKKEVIFLKSILDPKIRKNIRDIAYMMCRDWQMWQQRV